MNPTATTTTTRQEGEYFVTYNADGRAIGFESVQNRLELARREKTSAAAPAPAAPIAPLPTSAIKRAPTPTEIPAGDPEMPTRSRLERGGDELAEEAFRLAAELADDDNDDIATLAAQLAADD